MPSSRFEQLLPSLYLEVCKELERCGQTTSCISCAGILLRVLHRLGYEEALPLTVRVQIWNKAYTDWFQTHGDPEGNPEAVERCNAKGGLRIFVGVGEDSEGGWPGHLVVILPNAFGDQHALLDFTIVQANQPAFDVVLQPACLKVSSEFVSGEKPFLTGHNGCMLGYKPFPDDESYTETEAWTRTEGLDDAAANVLMRMG